MALIKEDGSGLADANSYATVEDCAAYHEGHLYYGAWDGAINSRKEEALRMATRVIDSSYQFNGWKRKVDQALQWPRLRCLDPDRWQSWDPIAGNGFGPFFPSDAVPPVIVQATCELARELLKADTTDAPDGQGISQFSITGSIHVQYHKRDQQPIIPRYIQLMLMKLGRYLDRKSGSVKLIRA